MVRILTNVLTDRLETSRDCAEAEAAKLAVVELEDELGAARQSLRRVIRAENGGR